MLLTRLKCTISIYLKMSLVVANCFVSPGVMLKLVVDGDEGREEEMVEERMEVVEVMSGWCGQEERRTERDCSCSHSYPAAAVTELGSP